MISGRHRSESIASLRQAVPYLRLYQGETFVLKLGGALLDEAESLRGVLEQIAILHQLRICVVVVHGGGPQTTRLSKELGIEARFVEGRRITCERTLQASTMVLNGSINTELVAAFRGLGVPAVGLSGVDGNLIQARRRAPQVIAGEEVDFGFVGDVVSMNTEVLRILTQRFYLPVVSPLSADESGAVLNLNADGVAARLALELKAAKLLFLTDVPGILERSGVESSHLSIADLEILERLTESGSISGGMLPKSQAIRDAIQGGVPRVHVISHRLPDSLLTEVFTNAGSGTMVVASVQRVPAEEQSVNRTP